MWPTSNAVGTERLVDYRGHDRPGPDMGWMTLHRANQTPATARDAAIDAAVQNALAPAANTTYGDVLPLARDNATGELRIALPAGLRSLAQGAWDVSQGPRTGGVTPEGTLALASLVNPLERPQEGVLHSFAGSKRALRELEAAGKAEGQTLLDKTIARTEGRDTVPVPLSEVVAKAAAEDAARAAPMADTPILRGIREESRVSTRAGEPPKAKPGEPAPVDPHTVATSNVSLDAMKAGDSYPKNAMLLRDGDFPDLPVKGLRSPDSIVHKSIQHMVDNLLFLHDEYKGKFGQETIDKAARWYDGAHKIALKDRRGDGLHARADCGVMANLSPQKDWYQNADLADRMIDIIRNGGGAKFSPEMQTWSRQ